MAAMIKNLSNKTHGLCGWLHHAFLLFSSFSRSFISGAPWLVNLNPLVLILMLCLIELHVNMLVSIPKTCKFPWATGDCIYWYRIMRFISGHSILNKSAKPAKYIFQGLSQSENKYCSIKKFSSTCEALNFTNLPLDPTIQNSPFLLAGIR